MRAWNWTVQKETAARLLAEGRMTGQEIAQTVGVARRTVCYWNNNATFRMRVETHVAQMCEAIRQEMIRRAKERLR